LTTPVILGSVWQGCLNPMKLFYLVSPACPQGLDSSRGYGPQPPHQKQPNIRYSHNKVYFLNYLYIYTVVRSDFSTRPAQPRNLKFFCFLWYSRHDNKFKENKMDFMGGSNRSKNKIDKALGDAQKPKPKPKPPVKPKPKPRPKPKPPATPTRRRRV